MIDKSLDLSCISDPIGLARVEWYVEDKSNPGTLPPPFFFKFGGTKVDGDAVY